MAPGTTSLDAHACGPPRSCARSCSRCSRSSSSGRSLNLLLWAFAEKWYFPYKLPQEFGLTFWYASSSRAATRSRRWGPASGSRVLTVVLSRWPWRFPPATRWRGCGCRGAARSCSPSCCRRRCPNLPVYVNIARVFYEIGLNGTIAGVVLVHASHGLVLAVWIASAAFASVDVSLEEAARNIGASPWTCFRTVTLPLAAPGLMASAIFVFLESLDEFTGTYFVGVPDVTTLPLLMFNASMGGNYQIASITALLLLIPSIGFMLVVERFLKADVLAMVGR